MKLPEHAKKKFITIFLTQNEISAMRILTITLIPKNMKKLNSSLNSPTPKSKDLTERILLEKSIQKLSN